MQGEELLKILKQTMWNQCALLLVLLAIGVCTLVFYLVYYQVTRSNKALSMFSFFPASRQRDTKKTLKQQITELGIALVVVLGVAIWFSYPMYRDINHQQIEEVKTQYLRTEKLSEGNLFSNGTAIIVIDGEQISVELPYGWRSEDFPIGEYSCVAWYAKESKVLLAIDILE